MVGGLLLDAGLFLAVPYMIVWLFLHVLCERWLEWRERQRRIITRLFHSHRRADRA